MADTPNAKTGAGLGTFAGVFTPSILTIVGIILFLRLGFVVGSAGWARALMIVLIANAISVLTSVSLSAIATNLRVKGGGDYYLISRTLGVRYGGALGLVLFLAQSVSIAFYCIGFGEAVAATLRLEISWLPQAIAAGAIAALFVLAWLGSDWATRFQFVVMAVLVSAIAAFLVGGIGRFDAATFHGNFAPAGELPFWAVFALFFPAVTGFTQGVSMSGDLENPGRSLPIGTFLAVGLSLLIYVGAAIVFAGGMAGTELVAAGGEAMRRLSAVPWLVDAGVIAATLSSALASFLGAPRILQSLAADRVFPLLRPFAVGDGAANNPRRGVVLSAAIAFITVALGDLDLIAPVVSMFFLISYGLLNYATWYEARANSPSFRPRFRFFDARLSLLGGLACLAAMMAINPWAGIAALIVLYAIQRYVAHSVHVERWADGERSHRMQRVREDLHAISADLEHPRDWRPVLLALSDDPDRRERMAHFASWIEGGAGFTTLLRIIPAEGPRQRAIRDAAETELRAELRRNKLSAFAKVIAAENPEEVLSVLLQAHGLGRVRTNTMLLNWYDSYESADKAPGLPRYGHYLRVALRSGVHPVILAAGPQHFERLAEVKRSKRRIDVWYRDNATGRLMLMLAYLMTRSAAFERARLRVLVPPTADGDAQQALTAAKAMLDEVRIVATPELVERPSPRSVVEMSADATVTFLPFRLPADVPVSAFDTPLGEMLPGLGITAMVLACQDLELDADPEAGRHGRITEAVDEADLTRRSAQRAEKEAEKAAAQVDQAREALEKARASDGGEAIETRKRELAHAGEAAERARRRAAKTRVKADAATREADEVTGNGAETPRDES